MRPSRQHIGRTSSAVPSSPSTSVEPCPWRCSNLRTAGKELEPGVYRGFELPTLPDGEPLLVSELVTMTSEWRCWILDGEVRAASTYRRRGQPHAEPLDVVLRSAGPPELVAEGYTRFCT
ncbi:hypothetical protein GCM10028777_12590 [Angustibacter speluncae]